MTPTDWDTESYCTIDGCTHPATHRVWTGLADGIPVTEMVCCHHANTNPPEAVTLTISFGDTTNHGAHIITINTNPQLVNKLRATTCRREHRHNAANHITELYTTLDQMNHKAQWWQQTATDLVAEINRLRQELEARRG